MTEQSKSVISDPIKGISCFMAALPSKLLRRISEYHEVVTLGKIIRINILEITMLRDFVSEQRAALRIGMTNLGVSEKIQEDTLKDYKLFLLLQDLSKPNDRVTPLFFGTEDEFCNKTGTKLLVGLVEDNIMRISNSEMFLDWLEVALLGVMTGTVKYSVEESGLKETVLTPDKNLPLQ